MKSPLNLLNRKIFQTLFYCVRLRKNALLIRIGVEIVWDNVDSVNEWILGCVSGTPRRFFAGADDITKERAWGRDFRTHSLSLIVTGFYLLGFVQNELHSRLTNFSLLTCRRPTCLDLPMAMRYRHLKQCSFNKDAVAVYR